ncbi:hypothetical protein AAG570_010919 [Ranatra chinensis]|uniref:BHLH domain-containing protein n=1 Tax=Ranatra chinensis TaxID=642074 RepID=A0ABD0YJD2_9HEMI
MKADGAGRNLSEQELLTPGLTIVEEEGSLESAPDDQATSACDPTPQAELPSTSSLLETSIDAQDDTDDVHYEFREDGMTYRVVQVKDESSGATATATLGTAAANAIAGAVANFTGATPTPVQGIYVLGGSDVFPLNSNQKTIISRSHEENSRPTVTVSRDDKRRQTHNEVERRRRDKINNWIMKLSKIIPECKQDSSKGSFESQSKGGILAKACDYIVELRESNQRLLVFIKENERLASDVEQLGRQVEELKIENEQLRSILQQNGIQIP